MSHLDCDRPICQYFDDCDRSGWPAQSPYNRSIQRLKYSFNPDHNPEKDLSFGERRMLDTARRLLIQEISIAKKADKRDIEKELDQIFAA